MTSPSRAAVLTSELKEEVERRLKSTHEDRISQLTQSLHNSLLSPFDRATVSSGPTAKAGATNPGQPRIADVFDELIRSDRASRTQQLADEVAFRDQELIKLRERLEKAQLEASSNKEHRDALQHQVAKATNSSHLLEQELRRLQKEHEILGQEVHGLRSGKATAERTAAIEQARATAAEQLAASRGHELDELKADYKRLLAEQQQQQSTSQKELQDLFAEATKQRSLAFQKEEQLAKELSSTSNHLLETKSALAAEKATNESLQTKLTAANESSTELKKQKKQLASNLKELEGLLAESERERKDVRAKYMKLGDQVEVMLQEEAEAKAAAAARLADIQQQLQRSDAEAAAQLRRQEQLSQQLAAAEQALQAAERTHKKAMRKLEKKMLQVVEEFEGSQQQLLLKSAEVIDLQSHLKELQLQHETQLAAADGQLEVLQSRVHQLEAELADASEAASCIREELAGQADDQLQLALRQQALKYERQLQELELQNRYMSAMDVLASANARKVLDQGTTGAEAGVLEAAGGRGVPSLEAFDARLRRTFEAHVSRAETGQAMEATLSKVRQELNGEWKKRLDLLQEEWQGRLETKQQELEARHKIKLQQVEQQCELEKERLQAQVQGFSTARAQMEQQLHGLRQELNQHLQESTHLHVQLEEAKALNKVLTARAEEAARNATHLQGVINQYGGLRGDKEALADLMAKLEVRTTERNQAMQAVAAAEAKLKVLESQQVLDSDKALGLQRQLQQAQHATEVADNTRRDLELRLHKVQGELQQAEQAAQAVQQQCAKLQEEKAKVAGKLEKALSNQKELSEELWQAQQQVREAKAEKQALGYSLAGSEAIVTRLKEEKDCSSEDVQELQAAKTALEANVRSLQDEVRRMGLLVQGLELSKQGLQRRVQWYEADHPAAPMRSDNNSPMQSFGGIHSLAGGPRRGSTIHASLDFSGGHFSQNLQDFEELMKKFDEERRTMLQRHEVLDIGNLELRQQLAAANSRISELTFNLQQLQGSLERAKGLTVQEIKTKDELADRVLSGAQRSAMDLQELNTWMQGELDKARKGQQAALAQASAAERKVLVLESQALDLQRANQQAKRDAELTVTLKLNRVSAMMGAELNSLCSKVTVLRDDARLQVSQALKDNLAALDDVNSRWQRHVKDLEAAQAAAQDTLQQLHQEQLQQLQQLQQQLKEQNMAAEAELDKAVAQKQQREQQLAMLRQAVVLSARALHGVLGGEALGDLQELEVAPLADHLQGLTDQCLQQLAELQADCDQLLLDSAALATDLGVCATNLQSVVATVAFNVPLAPDVQQGLNAKDQAAFDTCLEGLHEAIRACMLAERQQVSDRIEHGPLADLQQQLAAATADTEKKAQDIKALKAEKQEDLVNFEEALARCREECMEGADLARQESLSGLKAELQQMKAQLSELKEQHAAEVKELQASSSKQLSQHVKTADRIIKELEATASNLQQQLAAEVERAEGYNQALKRAKEEQERKQQLELRKERRQTGEIDNLRTRLRDMEAREKEKEEEMKQLKRSLRQKELTLLGSN